MKKQTKTTIYNQHTIFHHLKLIVSSPINNRRSNEHIFFQNKHKDHPLFMGINTARNALKACTTCFGSTTARHLVISLCGSEPMLNWDMLVQLFKHGQQQKNKWATLTWALNSSCALLTDLKAETLARHQVDVHLCLDGTEEKRDRHRGFVQTTTPLKGVPARLEMLRRAGCRVQQLNIGLTKNNINTLHGLVDFASTHDIERINARMTEYSSHTSPETLDPVVTARIIGEVIPYANEKGIFLEGPWKNAITGSDGVFPERHAQKFQVDPNGAISLISFTHFPLGNVNNNKRLQARYQRAELEINQKNGLQPYCNRCTLLHTCEGYLRSGAFIPPAGNSETNYRECTFALAILNILSGFPEGTVPEKCIHRIGLSKQLTLATDVTGEHVVHRTRGIKVKSSEDLLHLLEQFRSPKIVGDVFTEFEHSPDLRYTLHRLAEFRILVDPKEDEEQQWLQEKIALQGRTPFHSQHFKIIHHQEHTTLAKAFTCVLEEAWSRLENSFLPSPERRSLVFLAGSRKEFQVLWGRQALPSWPKAFIAAGRILVVDAEKLAVIDLRKMSFLHGMIHELTHIWLHEMGVALPVWMEEGLCEQLSRTCDNSLIIQTIQTKGLIGFREMEILIKHNLLDLDPSNTRTNICYNQSHSFIENLMSRCGSEPFVEYLSRLWIDTDHRQAFAEHFGYSMDAAERDWIEQMGVEPLVQKGLRPANTTRVVKNNDRVLLYNSRSGENIIASKSVLQLLKRLDGRTSLRELNEHLEIPRLKTVISELYSRGLLELGVEVQQVPPPATRTGKDHRTGYLVNKLRLNVSTECNLACSYCYIQKIAKNRELMAWNVAKESIDAFFTLLRSNDRTKGQIRFFGGEPLLNWSVTKRAIQYANKNKGPFKLGFIINTNGTIMDRKSAAFLARHKVAIAVSVDGLASVHDSSRPYKSGKGSFTSVNKTLRKLTTAGCRVGIETTLSLHNSEHLNDLIDFIAQLQDENNCTVPLGFQKVCMREQGVPDETLLAGKLKQAMSYAWSKGVDVDTGMVNKPFNALIGKRDKRLYCGAQGEELCVHPNGDITPCAAMPIKLGDINDLPAVFRSDSYQQLTTRYAGNIQGCRDCEIEGLCAGGCAADAFSRTDKLLSPGGQCQLEKEIFMFLVKERLLSNENTIYI